MTTMQQPVNEPGVALVTGATGIQGSHLVERLAKSPRWSKIYAVSRSSPSINNEKVKHLPVDLQEAPVEILQQLSSGGANDVTHVFFTAFIETGDDVKNVEVNFGMLKTLIESVERAGTHLKHVYLTTGLKWYGQQLPQNKTPYKEDDPRHFPPNFYYNQEDYLAKRVREGASWTWNALRPGPICGYSHGSAMNVVVSTALYATLCKELDLGVLRFPGPPESYNFAVDMTDVDLLVEAEEWLATNVKPDTANTAFNITNGDVTRWKHIWPVIARHFDMPVGEPQQVPLQDYMRDKESTWEATVEKYGLSKEFDWSHLGTWQFAEFVFQQPCDWITNTNKLKRAGFNEMKLDTEDMWARKLQELTNMGVIPDYRSVRAHAAREGQHMTQQTGMFKPTRLDQSGQEAEVPVPTGSDQAAAGYGAKGAPTARDAPTTGGPAGGQAMPDTGALSGTRGDDLPAGGRDTNLNPPAITQSNMSENVIDVTPPPTPPQAILIQDTEVDIVPVPVPVPVMVTPDVGSMVTPDVSSDTPARGYGQMPDTRTNGVAGGNGDGAPVSSDAAVPPGERLHADNLLGQV